MPVALPALGALTPIEGVRCAAVAAGVRHADRDDVVLFELCRGARVAGVFTRNRFRAAPVRIAEASLAATQGRPRYWLVNTGNANAGTGADGKAAAQRCCTALAALTRVREDEVLPFSTGVIGEALPDDRIRSALPAARDALAADGWAAAASGILTTDTGPKGASVTITGTPWSITGIAKGAGMIRPDMATMLAFLATDAPIGASMLDGALRRAVDASFNRITVDGDTSTNDAVVLAATGEGDMNGPQFEAFVSALTDLCVQLAQAIVRDGEGATRFVTVDVRAARSSEEALLCAYAVAQSPLVKTALFAGDPNWGRLLAAIGRAGIDDLDVEGVTIDLGDVRVAERGAVAASYREADGERVMAAEEVTITIDLGRGDVAETVWTTDLSHEYVRINAEYRS